MDLKLFVKKQEIQSVRIAITAGHE